MNWKTESSTQAALLEQAMQVYRHALALGKLAQSKQAGITEEQLNRLRNSANAAEKLHGRLKKGEFRVAVVGMEKAGKSTFVNAWLGCNLLPAKSERCTFTTTQLYSVSADSEQRLETEPKTAPNFRQYLADLKQQCESSDSDARKRAEQDLDVIAENKVTLQEVIEEGTRTLRFTRLDEIFADLNKYVADQRYAHAMEEARLYTKELAEVDGVVFFDVPGLDSGLSKHVDETKEILADCDAIIVIQHGRFVSLKAHEQDIIEYGKTGDKYISLADKLFVFWGQIDLKPSIEVLEADWQKVLSEWGKFGISKNRIVRGSAGAHLILNGYAIPEVGDEREIRAKMEKLAGGSDVESVNDATGILELALIISRAKTLGSSRISCARLT